MHALGRHRFRILAVVLLGGLLAAPAPQLESAWADEGDKATPMLEVEIDVAGTAVSLGAQAAAVTRHVRARPGFVRSDLARVPGSPARVLRATVWDSIESLEAASLARDGHASETAWLRAVDAGRRTRRHFRQLRAVRYARAATGHLEVTFYRTRAGTTREANLARFDKAEADFARGEGILAHSMWIAPDGLWAHVVHWASEDAFKKTGRALMQTKGVGGWIRSLDFKRFKVWKGGVVGER